MTEEYNVDQLLKIPLSRPNFTIDGLYFGRGDVYVDQNSSVQFKHTTLGVKCWRIVKETLEEMENESNRFYSGEAYVVSWRSRTDSLPLNTDEVTSTQENQVYFYWKGADAGKGYSPLPETIDNNSSVQRIVQWAEPPAFLQLFSGTFLVHRGGYGDWTPTSHLYLLRGEVDTEIHLYEVEPNVRSLRSRTSFIMHIPHERKCILWHGNKSSTRCRDSAKKSIENIFRAVTDVIELEEGCENDVFLGNLQGNTEDYFRHPELKVVDYTPRLFYFNNITGKFLVVEIESSHKSEFLTPFPVLQSHLYTADPPAIFLLDDNDEIWIWYGVNHDQDADFKSYSFIVALNYAKLKSKIIQRLVKVHKVIAGFEPKTFTNLFPVWENREDIAQLQEKAGVLPNLNTFTEMISHEANAQP